MLKKCALCGKGEMTGKSVTRKGQYKKKGGTGSKIARWTKRKFFANLQKMTLIITGHPKRVYVCTKCIKKGELRRA
jgi:large subunit ribosomal protein L28